MTSIDRLRYAVVSLFFIALTPFASGCSCQALNPVVAKVGDHEIRARDVELRNKVARLYHPGERQDLGLEQLVRAYSFLEILKKYGRPVTPEQVAAEDERIEKNTKAPDMLARIHAVFGSDKDAYRRNYVLPTYVERVLYYDFFLRDPEIQEKALERANFFLTQIKKSKRRDLSFLDGISRNFNVTLELRNLPKDALPKELARLKKGQVFPYVIDQGEVWDVLIVEGFKKDEVTVRTATFPKEDFGPWIEHERQKVQVTLFSSK